MKRRALVLVWLILMGGCGDAGGRTEDGPPAEAAERPADRPLLPRDAVRLDPVFQLAEAGRLGHPRDLAVEEGGNVYVLDFAAPSGILKYDPTGGFLLRFGARDEDRDFISALEMDLASWNTLLVVDRGRNTIDTYLTIGTFGSSIEVTPAVALDVHALPAFGEFYLHKWDAEGRRSTVLRVRAPYDSLATVYEVRIPSGASIKEQARAVHYHTATDRQGRLYVGFYDGYPVRVLDPTGRTVRLIDLDREPMIKSPEEIQREEEENLARLMDEAPRIDEELLREAARPDSLWPVIEELTVDPSRRLWVRTRRPDAEGVTPYDVFNEQGDYLVRVDVPGIVERTTFAPDGRIFVIVERENGDREIRGYGVVIGGNARTAPG
ncbi:MAG: hypothetical protein ACREMD_09730, partial [Gemmatimonadota bacterium]